MTSLFHRTVLALGGATALGIGLALALAPGEVYAGMGVSLTGGPTLTSDLRAQGATLAALGAAMLAGLRRPALARLSAGLGALVYGAYGVGRGLGLALDGMPSEGVLVAFAVEATLAAACLLALRATARGDRPRPA